MFKRSQNCLFVEEEIYNWSSPKSRVNRHLVALAVLFVISGVLLSALRLA
ncbi:MAG: hypothetical protein ACE37N_11195 [Pseudohongiellaceae bacterium]